MNVMYPKPPLPVIASMFFLFLLAGSTLASAGSPSSALPSEESAQPQAFSFDKADSIRTLLEKNIGKPVALIFDSGTEVEGVVSAVGDQVVRISHLTGLESFDALIRLERICTIMIHVRED